MEDRKKLRTTLQNCIHRLKVEELNNITTKLLNIYPGEETSENVNVTGSVKNVIQQMVEFQRNLPEVFHERLSSKDVTMPERKKTKMLKLNLET